MQDVAKYGELMPEDFWHMVRMNVAHGQRTGQAVFNAADVLYPWEVSHLRSSRHDPFHRDERIPDFIRELVNWITKPER